MRKLLRDQRGQAETTTWILAQPVFWLMVAILVAITMLGLRRASAVLATHNAGLAAGRVDAAAGEGAAEHVLSVWWGPSSGSGTVPVAVTESSQFRSVQAYLDTEWDTTAQSVIGSLSIRASTWQRKEDFYAGPPSEDGFE
jgi:hypothetical protein